MLDSNKVRDLLTIEQVIQLCCELQGDDTYYYDNYGNLIFNTCLDHPSGDSWKEWYFIDSKTFRCFTRGESYDIFEMVRRAKGLDEFIEAYRFVVNYFHLKDDGTCVEQQPLTDDWSIFQTIQDFNKKTDDGKTNGAIQENLLEYFFPLATPVEWLRDHISPEVMRYYGIRVDSALHKIIIPHRNVDGELIGIRGRTYDPFELEEGKKYMPVFIQGEMYNHMLGKNLFGLYENKDTIRKIKKVLIVESEKAVMQCASYYGVDNCFCVATCGSSLSQDQINLILQLGVTEVILGYDREFHGHFGDPDTEEYEKKLIKTVKPLTLYFNTYIIMDYDHLTGYKDSPTDCGKEILEKLMHQKIYVAPIHEEKVKRRKKK